MEIVMNQKLATSTTIAILILAAIYVVFFNPARTQNPPAATPPPTATIKQIATDTLISPTSTPEPVSTSPAINKPYQTLAIVISDDFDHRRENPETDPTQNTDVILLFVLDRHEKIIHIIQLPRDLYIPVAVTDENNTIIGYLPNRINTAYAFGGLTGLRDTLHRVTQLHFQNIIYIDPDTFIQIAEQNISYPVRFKIPSNTSWDELTILEQCAEKIPEAGNYAAADSTVTELVIHTSLEMSLCYARDRSPDSFHRMKRVQWVGLGMVETYLQTLTENTPLQNLDQATLLFNAYKNDIVHDLSITDFANLAGLYFTLSWDLNFITIEPPLVRPGTTEFGWSVLFPPTEGEIIANYIHDQILP
jgi:hypothetical protein